jgi:hypothetical protein
MAYAGCDEQAKENTSRGILHTTFAHSCIRPFEPSHLRATFVFFRLFITSSVSPPIVNMLEQIREPIENPNFALYSVGKMLIYFSKLHFCLCRKP